VGWNDRVTYVTIECRQCGENDELEIWDGDNGPLQCPHCGSTDVFDVLDDPEHPLNPDSFAAALERNRDK
jgi:hypothetical protein